MANKSSSSLTCFLFFLSVASSALVCARNIDQHFQSLAVDSLLPQHVCNAVKGLHSGEQRKKALKIFDLHGPCSPFHTEVGQVRNDTQAFKEILQHDQSRVMWINSRMSPSSSPHNEQLKDAFLTDAKTSIPASGGGSLGTGNFIVTVGLGSPKTDFYLVLDTGSDITWVQCEPCSVSCYQQQGPRFSPSASSTYQTVPCYAQQCADVKAETGASGCSATQRCLYGVSYGDNSYSVGYFSRDTLTMAATDVFPGFAFGCGQNNKGLFGMTGGILGLGRGKLSAVTQTTNKYGGLFSYCLPSSSSPGYLTFGSDSSYSAAQFTPLISNPQHPYYFVSLTGISVAGQLLPVSSSVFQSPGTIIDSGTVITRLQSSVYNSLKSTFRSMMNNYPLAQPLNILDTCYDLSSYSTVQVPVIRFHFQGGTVLALDIPSIFFVPSTSQACLAFAANSNDNSVAIIGNRQQKGTQIIHDNPNGRIGFRPGACN